MSPLQKQLVPVSFGQGVETKVDQKQVTLGKLLALENATFESPQKLTKRNGYAFLTQYSASGNGDACALMSFRRGLLLADGIDLYTYNESGGSGGPNEWVPQGTMENTGSISQKNIAIDPTYQIFGYDLAVHSSGIQCAVFERGESGFYGGISYTLIDTATGTTLVPPTSISSSAGSPKVVVVGSLFVITYILSGVLYGLTVDTSTFGTAGPTAFTSGSGATKLSTTSGAAQYDVCVSPSGPQAGLYVVFNNDVSSTNRGWTIIQCAAATPIAPSGLSYTATASLPGCVCVFMDTFTVAPVVGYSHSTSSALFIALKADLSGYLGSGTLYTGGISGITGISTSSAAIAYSFAFSSRNIGNFQNDLTQTNTVAGVSYTPGSSSVVRRSVSVCGKLFLATLCVGSQPIPIVRAAFDTAGIPSRAGEQTTFFLLDLQGNQIARYASGSAGGHYQNASSTTTAYYMLPESPAYGSSFLLPGTAAYGSSIVSGAAVLQAGLFEFPFTPIPGYLPRAVSANTLLMGGSAIFETDNAGAPVEYWFAYYPWFTGTLSSDALGGGMTPSATYSYIFTYEWTDANGQVQRSVPSQTEQSVTTITMGASDTEVLGITFATLRVTAKVGARGAVQIVMYRDTAATPGVFYRVKAWANDTTVDTLPASPYTDTASDASIAGNEQLYTTGGVLDNDTPPPTQAMVQHRNRVWLVDSTSPLSVWFSQEVIPTPGLLNGTPILFSAFQVVNAPSDGDGVTALGSLDDKMIAFKQYGPIYYLTGQGPTSTGANNDFSDFQRISVDCGCANQASVVGTPMGLMFQSDKGIYLLTRNLSVEYIGAPVESYNSQTVTSAVLIANTNQVRFTMSGGATLVYDYLVGQWSVFTFQWFATESITGAVDACVWQGGYVFAGSTSAVFEETPGVYEDVYYLSGSVNSYIPIRALTPPISLAGLQGFQRIYKVFVLGSAYTACTMTVQLGYNFQALSQSNAITVAGTETPLQWRIDPQIQKCEAIQIQISDAYVAGKVVGEGIDLSGFSLEVGLKTGGFRLPAAQSTG